ncbi:hypothetical protein J3E69DRAFT_350757 [Trichoderma sp. SZMC 28015]
MPVALQHGWSWIKALKLLCCACAGCRSNQRGRLQSRCKRKQCSAIWHSSSVTEKPLKARAAANQRRTLLSF